MLLNSLVSSQCNCACVFVVALQAGRQLTYYPAYKVGMKLAVISVWSSFQ